MPYRMRNRFLILGLTGPLGAGCTTTAKFLSGQRIEGTTLRELVSRQIAQRSEIQERIKEYYEKIADLRKRSARRLDKNLGPYKQSIINANDDPKLQSYEKEAKKYHDFLKIYLNRREVSDVLDVFLKDDSFEYKNINGKDLQLFGLKPFAYISFTTIIMKMAFEAFHAIDGEKRFSAYFERKFQSRKDDLEPIYKEISKFIREQLQKVDGAEKSKYFTASEYVRDRHYQIFKISAALRIDDEIKEKIITSNKAIVELIYKYLEFINETQNSLKSFIAERNDNKFNDAFSDILQDWGENCRATRNPFDELTVNKPDPENIYTLSTEINDLIKFIRYRLRYLDKEFRIAKSNDNQSVPALFVVECFRNPFEAEFFRSRYAEFYLLSVSADLSIREKRVKHFSQKREGRDQGDPKKPAELHKLDVRSCVLLSDIALLNNRQESKSLIEFFEKLMRYFALIRSPGCIPPTDNELYMHLAYSHSLKSTCISRKVGAIILGPQGYIFGAGWNDVGEGQIGCGLRHIQDYQEIDAIPKVSSKKALPKFNQLLSESKGKYVCYKDITSKLQVNKKLDQFRNDPFCNNQCIDQIGEELGIKRLEFCRALHAEENALLQISKAGGMPIKNGTIYTTTYPCELCAKKLYQTGIRTVYYTEPYPESISDEVFFKDGTKNILRISFEGVKSHSYFRLFKPIYDKKELSLIEADLNLFSFEGLTTGTG